MPSSPPRWGSLTASIRNAMQQKSQPQSLRAAISEFGQFVRLFRSALWAVWCHSFLLRASNAAARIGAYAHRVGRAYELRAILHGERANALANRMEAMQPDAEPVAARQTPRTAEANEVQSNRRAVFVGILLILFALLLLHALRHAQS